MKWLDQYEQEVEVVYKDERYLVRDNGRVFRKYKPDRRRSRYDEIWTFGRWQKSTNYMYIGSQAIHRIVATAFHGVPPSAEDVVDHIDMDKCNNRAENLRWIPKLVNLLRHPSKRKSIIRAYGSLDNFYTNHRAATTLPPTLDWVRNVPKEDVERCRNQLIEWAESERLPKDGNLTNRVYGMGHPSPHEPDPDTHSLTPLAFQRNWKTPTEFPCCPIEIGSKTLDEYMVNLCSGAVFSRDRYKESTVEMAGQNGAFLSVLTASNELRAIKPWAVAKVTVEKGKFIHESIGSFFELTGAKKAYYGLLGVPFSGKSFDDFC